MRRDWFPKAYADVVARLRVPFGFLLLVLFLLLSRPGTPSLRWGMPVAALGLLVRAWAAGHLAKNERLATGGPYAFVRNPLYVGTLLTAAGFAIASRSGMLAGIFAVVFLLVYLPVIELEEQHLRKLFPEYASYAERTPMLWPRWGVLREAERFRWSLYVRNQEYKALAATAAGALYLAWRA